MKRKIIFILSIYFLVFSSLFFIANAEQYDRFSGLEHIKDFNTIITVNSDATINVVENIIYDFDTIQKHGIFRDIPVKYKDEKGLDFNFNLSNISVENENGESYPFSVSDYNKKYKRIKIGDPNIEIDGVHVYKISYTVDRAIGYFADHDEIYWNATGDMWPVPISSAEAQVNLPESINKKDLKIACYFGFVGSTKACAWSPKAGESVVSDGISIVEFNPVELDSFDGMTVAVGFPKGIVKEPTKVENAISAVKDNFSFIYFVPIILFLFLFGRWYEYGRDPKGTGVIVAEYDVPDGLTPLEVAGIVYNGSRNKDISAEIVSLAVKGYLTIDQKENLTLRGKNDYILKKIKEGSNLTTDHERLLMESLFSMSSVKMAEVASLMNDLSDSKSPIPQGIKTFVANQLAKKAEKTYLEASNNEVKLSSLENSFYTIARRIQSGAMELLVKNGFYDKAPKSKIGNGKGIVGPVVLGLFFSVWASGFVSVIFGFAGIISTILTVWMIVFFTIIMPRRTEKGVAMYERLLGLKEYLQIAEKDRINFHNAPEKKPELFEKLLPYAMVFGVEKAWAKEFEGIYMTPPSWYHGMSGTAFSAGSFVSSMNNFSSVSSSTLSSSPSSSGGGHGGSSGGGSSGGGGGGGGGGSW
ncbi:MAG: DUF2207 domain-containing protein [bacterium]